jgi:hypothetical protein
MRWEALVVDVAVVPVGANPLIARTERSRDKSDLVVVVVGTRTSCHLK